jgi:transcriptional regulator with XRE-family HTH domain
MVLRALRHRTRLTQAQLGSLAGVSRSIVSKVELGEIAGVTVGTLTAVFEAAGARLEYAPYGTAPRWIGSWTRDTRD